MRTFDPGATLEFAVGSCDTTVPAGRLEAVGYESTCKPFLWMRTTAACWLSPTTFGTMTEFLGG